MLKDACTVYGTLVQKTETGADREDGPSNRTIIEARTSRSWAVALKIGGGGGKH